MKFRLKGWVSFDITLKKSYDFFANLKHLGKDVSLFLSSHPLERPFIVGQFKCPVIMQLFAFLYNTLFAGIARRKINRVRPNHRLSEMNRVLLIFTGLKFCLQPLVGAISRMLHKKSNLISFLMHHCPDAKKNLDYFIIHY